MPGIKDATSNPIIGLSIGTMFMRDLECSSIVNLLKYLAIMYAVFLVFMIAIGLFGGYSRCFL